MSRRDAPWIWDANASHYARQESLEGRAVETAVRLAAPAPGEHLVDVATGTGIVLRTLAGRPPADRPRSAIGVDASRRMLAQVGTLPAGWELRQADARALPLDDASADVVTCTYLLHLLSAEDRATVVAEIRRILKVGGRVVVATPWSPRLAVRAVLTTAAFVAPAKVGGLAPLDPTDDLRAAGLEPRARVVLPRRGYPTVVVLADAQ